MDIVQHTESPAAKIFCYIWLLLDCWFDDLMVGFLCFDIIAAFEWEDLIILLPTESLLDVPNKNCAFPLSPLLAAFIMLLSIIHLNNGFSFDEASYSEIFRM